MTQADIERLRSIKTLPQLVAYLRDALDWPIESDDIEEISFSYEADELGLDDKHAAKINQIRQIRPLHAGQPWGIFWVSFEKKRLPVVVLRRILASLVVQSRQNAKSADRPRWKMNDLLFISAYGDEDAAQREISFAHFKQDDGDLPTLRVLGWDGADTELKLDHVVHTLAEKLHWPSNPSDSEHWRQQWSSAFRHRLGHIIRTSDALAETLAALARNIRDAARKLLEAESERGPLTRLFKAFQAALIHDLTPDTFADTYAQTITYGLFTAAVNRTDMSGGTEATFVKADDMALMTRSTSPFLKEMLETFLHVGGRKNGVDFDELGIQDVVELLRGDETDLPAILRDFGNRTRGEDPVIHFYEHFLSAYNKKLKIQRGVFYTPQPVVSYIVRGVHELLQTEFGLEDGLASTVTWGEMIKKHPDLKLPPLSDESTEKRAISPEEPFVQILDPATGTATFLVEAVDVIYRTLVAKWKEQGRLESEIPKLWNEYVPKHLLPRLHGYELLAAPYAIAHLKLGLKLTATGYRFGGSERARIYLTNSLEPKVMQLPHIGFEPLAHEAQAVNEIKWYKCFTVVIGNPPYSGHSVNASRDENNELTFIGRLIEEYKEGCPELFKPAQAKWLHDDYVKFIRLAEHILRRTQCRILGYITNHSYLNNPTFRGMRRHLCDTFESLRFLDLHGNIKRVEESGSTVKDDNVFDIQQGVAIQLSHAAAGCGTARKVSYGDLWGTRSAKYDVLGMATARSTKFKELRPKDPLYLFLPRNEELLPEYERGWRVPDVFSVAGDPAPGIVSTHDEFAFAFTKEGIAENVESLLATKSEDEARQLFRLCSQDQWSYRAAKQELANGNWKKKLLTVLYRPFDFRVTINDSNVAVHRRERVLRQMIGVANIAICTNRQVNGSFRHVFCSRNMVNDCALSTASKERTYILPLYLLPEDEGQLIKEDKRPNLGEDFLESLAQYLKLDQGGAHGLPCGVTPEDIFHYAYAVFHSPGYRNRYAEFLKIDFPRLPLTGDLELFRALAQLGSELVALHLLESSTVEHPITEYLGGRAPDVEKVFWSKNTVWVDKAQTTGFKGVREDVWNFHIGGYQVCEKWLKDRKGRQLSADDRTHYQKIIVVLSETIRLMAEIDKVIEKHGGWPLR